MTNKMILLVEDNPDDEALTLRAFRMSNAASDVKVVRDGVEALDYLLAKGQYAARDIKDTPALVLLDLKLPKIDGLEVLRQLRASHPTRLTPVVILSTSREDRDVLRGYQLGCNSYIRKPVNFDKFAEAIQTIARFWLELNELPAEEMSPMPTRTLNNDE